MFAILHKIFSKWNRMLSRPLVKWLEPYESITPNRVTYFTILLEIISITYYALGGWVNLIIGGIVMYISLVFDLVDGDLARKRNQLSTYGEYLDTATDRIFGVLRLVGMGIGLRNLDLGLYLGDLQVLGISEFDLGITYWMLTLYALVGSYLFNYLGMYDYALSFKYDQEIGKPRTAYKKNILFVFTVTNNIFAYLVVFGTLSVVMTFTRFFNLLKKYGELKVAR